MELLAQVSDAQLRRWLTLLRRPDRLAEPAIVDLLRAHGRLPETTTHAAVGAAAADLLVEAIERLRPPAGAGRDQQLPHVVLHTCFVEGAKLFQAAGRLGMSERQLSRERAWAITLLREELSSTAARPASAPGPAAPAPGLPTIAEYLPRPDVTRLISTALFEHRLVEISGPAGVGKTSLVADLAADDDAAVLWLRIRPGVSDSLTAVLFELGEHLRDHGRPELADYIGSALPVVDDALATRIAIRGLAGTRRLIVIDDFHLVTKATPLRGFVEEACLRTPDLRAALLSRHVTPAGAATQVSVPPLTEDETDALLNRLGIRCDPTTVSEVHRWTSGIAHLVRLAAAWLKSTSPEQVAQGWRELADAADVRAFLLGTVTDLLDSDDRAILEAASVFRDRFSDDAVAEVAGRSRGEVIDASLRLVHAHAATRSRTGDCAFFHSSVRQYVYDVLSAERRFELHSRAAEWFTRQGTRAEAKHHRAAADQAATELPGVSPITRPRERALSR